MRSFLRVLPASVALLPALLACSNPSDAPAKPRTLVTRSLQPTSPQNLIMVPLDGAEGKAGWGAFYGHLTGPTDKSVASLAMARTFLSDSPVGGAAAVEQIDFASGTGAVGAHMTCVLLGGPGAFHASIYVAAVDASADPTIATTELQVSIYTADDTQRVDLVPSADSPITFGGRRWMHLVTAGDIAALPDGGFFYVAFESLMHGWLFAAPEVTSTALGATPSSATVPFVPVDTQSVAPLAKAMKLDIQTSVRR